MYMPEWGFMAALDAFFYTANNLCAVLINHAWREAQVTGVPVCDVYFKTRTVTVCGLTPTPDQPERVSSSKRTSSFASSAVHRLA